MQFPILFPFSRNVTLESESTLAVNVDDIPKIGELFAEIDVTTGATITSEYVMVNALS